MRHLIALLHRRLDGRAGDRGAIAVLTALLASAVLVGFTVIAVDTGRLFDEHRQLRNGADAAAVALAQLCAEKAFCAADGLTRARTVARANDTSDAASGGATVVDRVCGTVRDLPACPPRPADSPSLSTCPPAAAGEKYVEVRIRTGTPDGRDVVDPVAAREGTAVGSCARAGYGSPTSLTSGIPIAVSRCEVDQYKATHTNDFAPRPTSNRSPFYATTTLRAKYEDAIVLHTGGKGDDCTNSAGQTAPGNFGYIEDGSAACPVVTQVDSTIGGDTGNALTKQCDTSYMTALIGTVVFLPVFDSVTGSGSNVNYLVKGYVPFFVTGWTFPGRSNDAGVTKTCPPSDTCVYGMYVRAATPPTAPSDADVDPRPLGSATTKLLG